jgi:hypothetical protein
MRMPRKRKRLDELRIETGKTAPSSRLLGVASEALVVGKYYKPNDIQGSLGI